MISSDSCFLLVEDDPRDIQLTQLAFARIGLAPPPVAHDGVEAIDFLLARGSFAGREGDKPPVAILLDLKMPGMGGLEFLEWLRHRAPEHLRSLPVIVVSTSGDLRDIARADELGVSSYMVKPIGMARFEEMIGSMYRHWCATPG
jgi:two-component system response regulator